MQKARARRVEVWSREAQVGLLSEPLTRLHGVETGSSARFTRSRKIQEAEMADPSGRGRFVLPEPMTTDTKSAASFYSKVGGWSTKPWENDPSYTMFLAKKSPMAGFMTIPDEAKAQGTPPNWLTY